jgi:hypothetical protein
MAIVFRLTGEIGACNGRRQGTCRDGLGQSCLGRQAPSRPMSLPPRFPAQRCVDQLRHVLLTRAARSTGLELIVKPGDAALTIARAPQCHRRSTHPVTTRDVGVGFPIGHAQHHLCSLHDPTRQALRAGNRLQLQPVLCAHRQSFCWSSHRALRWPRILLGPHSMRKVTYGSQH